MAAGEHTLTGHWFLPCGEAEDNGWIDGPCEKRSHPVEVFANPVVIEFLAS